MQYHRSQVNETPSELLESILEGSTEYGIIATDLNDRIVIWNKGAEYIYGYSSEEMIGNYTPIDLHGTDPINNDILYLVKNTFDSRIYDYEMNALRKDGSTIPVSVTVSPRLNQKKMHIGFLIIVRDITKIKLQGKFRDVQIEIAHVVNYHQDIQAMCNSIIDTINKFLDIPVIFICMLDEQQNKFSISSQVGLNDRFCCRSCKYTQNKSEVAHENLSCFNTYSQLTINSDKLENHSIKDFISNEGILNSDTSIIHIPLLSDIALIGILHIVVPTSTKNFLLAETQVLSLIANEISAGIQRKKLEKEIKIYANNLEKMVKERTDELRIKDAQLVQSGKLANLGEMATGIAHEINQPLGSISLMTQGLILAMKKSKLNESLLTTKLNSIIKQIDRIDKIINHLRTFARQASEPKEEIDINKPLRDVFEFIGQQLKNRNIAINLELGNNLPLILADHNKLEQVFLNIIGNARDALDEFEEKIKSMFENSSYPEWVNSWNKQINIKSYSDSESVFVKVSDNAGGIPDSIVQKIFEPFFTTKDVGKGTGLGLSISYGIVKEFGGNIEVESYNMKGSTFIIEIPFV